MRPHAERDAGTRGRIYLLRHGQSVANVKGIIASSLRHAGDAYGLTDEGRRQVQRSVTAAIAAGTLGPGARIVSSPLLRARETAQVAADLLGGEVRIDPRLIERGFGEFELRSDENYERIWAVDRINPSHTEHGVESIVSILTRMAALVAELDAEGATGPSLLCTHGDVTSTVLCAAGGHPLTQHREVGSTGNAELRVVADHGIGRAIPTPSHPPI